MDHLTKMEMVEDALELYRDSILKKIESMPEFKELCDRELNKALSTFPHEVQTYICNAKSLKQREQSKWKTHLMKLV